MLIIYKDKRVWVIIGGVVLIVLLALVVEFTQMPQGPEADGLSQNAIDVDDLPEGSIVNLGGTVASVGTSSIVVTTTLPKEPTQTTTVLVDSTTILSKLVAKDASQLAQERADAQAAGTAPPEPFAHESITLADLQAGMLVTIALAPGTMSGSEVVHAASIGVLPITP